MMKGKINQVGSPIIEIEVYGRKGKVTIEGILDTGFDGFICLPIALAVPLELELRDVTDSELADGTIIENELVFGGKVRWQGKMVMVDILLTKASDTLIGTGLLKDSEINLNFRTGEMLIN